MHCLGAVASGQATSPPSPSVVGFTTTTTSSSTSSSNSNTNNNNNNNTSRGNVLSAVRALGVLVCEGRIQGPPRGYKDGPHCVPPLQSAQPNNHVCEKDNYLCDRYLVLVREITERVSLGAYLCVEVVLCSDCPCGQIKSKSKHRVVSVTPALTSRQHGSEMLLEYWCIGVVPSKSPETMNSQGLYQAVRSRLHFSQVAAWWSRTNGAKPSYIATRIVSQPGQPDDHLRRFRETPVEHTFPLAGLGDGNSIKVTVWALPRMEDIPELICPMHQDDTGIQQLSRPATPVKRLIPTAPLISLNNPSPTTTTTSTNITNLNLNNNPNSTTNNLNTINAQQQQPSSLSVTSLSSTSGSNHQQTFVYYMNSFRAEEGQIGLLDDRLQIDCDKPGKHHCHCAEEEDDVVEEASPASVVGSISVRPNGERKRRRSLPCRPPEPTIVSPDAPLLTPPPAAVVILNPSATPPSSSIPPLLQSSNQLPVLLEAIDFPQSLPSTNSQTDPPPPQLSSPNHHLDSPAPVIEIVDGLESKFRTQLSIEEQQGHLEKRYKRSESITIVEDNSEESKVKLAPNTNTTFREHTINLVVNPMYINELQQQQQQQRDEVPKKVKIRLRTKGYDAAVEQGHLNRLMSKLSFPQEKETPKQLEQQQPQQQQTAGGGILDWISRVPGRVLGAEQQQQPQTTTTTTTTAQPAKCEVKMRNNFNLELSPREFDEVLAVLRARTPLSRKRSAVRTAKRRDKYERLLNETQSQQQQQQNQVINKEPEKSGEAQKSKPADLLLRAILKSSSKESNGRDEIITEMGMTTAEDVLVNEWSTTSPAKDESEPATGGSSSSSSFSSSSDSPSNAIIDDDCSSLPSAINKRLSRLRQLFKRPEQERQKTSDDRNVKPNHIPADSRAKRRIDFSNEPVVDRDNDDDDDEEDNTGDDELGEDDEDDDHDNNDDEEEEKKGDHEVRQISCCEDSKVGTSKNNSAHLIFHSTKREKRSNAVVRNRLEQRRIVEDRSNDSTTRKLRAKHDLSPIWIKHNNNNNNNSSCNNNNNKNIVNGELKESQVNNKPDVSAAEESESGTEIEQDGIEPNDRTAVPSAKDQARFRRSLENAASMVFHSRTGLPLTSSPAPLRRGSCCFDFDSSLNSVSSKRSALFELNTPPSPGAVSLEEGDRETECVGDLEEEVQKRRSSSRHRPQSHALLGSFEESALNGRLEPVSTVHGFTAEIGASGTFCPKHRKLPVTVFFYTLGDNDKVSSPYLAHINLGKKAYQVPRAGTIQVTLLNPLGTVVKMFVVLYDLADMPPRSHTFLRQRTLRDKTLRYLIHLRFMSGKTGRIYLHTDVRMIICRKADVDTASDFGSEPPKELRSYTHGPTNPKFSPRC